MFKLKLSGLRFFSIFDSYIFSFNAQTFQIMIFFFSRQSNFQILKTRGFWNRIFLHSRQLNFNESYFISFSQQAQSKLRHLHDHYILCKSFFLNQKFLVTLPNILHGVSGNPKHTIICLGLVCMYLLPHACINIFLIYLLCEHNWILY